MITCSPIVVLGDDVEATVFSSVKALWSMTGVVFFAGPVVMNVEDSGCEAADVPAEKHLTVSTVGVGENPGSA